MDVVHAPPAEEVECLGKEGLVDADPVEHPKKEDHPKAWNKSILVSSEDTTDPPRT